MQTGIGDIGPHGQTGGDTVVLLALVVNLKNEAYSRERRVCDVDTHMPSGAPRNMNRHLGQAEIHYVAREHDDEA